MADWSNMTIADLEQKRNKLVATIWHAVNDFHDETQFQVNFSGWFDEESFKHKIDVSVVYPPGKG